MNRPSVDTTGRPSVGSVAVPREDASMGSPRPTLVQEGRSVVSLCLRGGAATWFSSAHRPLVLPGLVLGICTTAAAQQSSTFDITWSNISGSEPVTCMSPAFELTGSISPIADGSTGAMSSVSFEVLSGFWVGMPASSAGMCPNEADCSISIADEMPGTGCDDCNLNRILDECDLSVMTSLDLDMNMVPDECIELSGGCPADDSWSCAQNWSLGSGFPGDGVVDKRNVTIGIPHATANVVLDVDVTIDTLRVLENTTLAVSQAGVEGDLTVDGAGGLRNSGIINVAGNRTIGVTGDVTIVNADGSYAEYQADLAAPPNTVTAALNCGRLEIGHLGSAKFSQDMTLHASGDLVLDGTGEMGACNVDGGKSWPKIRFGDAAVGVILQDIVLIGLCEFANYSLTPISIGGHFANASTSPDCFDCEQGGIRLDGAQTQVFEVGGADLGPIQAGFQHSTHTNFSVKTLEISGGAPTHTVWFENAFPNTVGAEACNEALYVHDLILRAGSSIVLDDVRVYYDTLTNEGGTIMATGCAQLLQVGTPCVATGACDDQNACTFDCRFGSGPCMNLAVEFGNVNGTGPVNANLDDILCVLAGFGNAAACPNADIDPCQGGPNLINLDDILKVLSAFAGADPCGCVP